MTINTSIRKAIQFLASKLISTLGRREAWLKAWEIAKNAPILLIEITSTKGVKSKRVVSEDITNYYTPKSSGRTRKEGLTLFADLVKFAKGISNPIISTYEYQAA